MRLSIALAPTFFCLAAVSASAAVIRVPADKPTIQQAIDDAGSFDEIVVSPGTYNENLLIDNKQVVTLRGKGTVKIQGAGANAALKINDGFAIAVKNLRLLAGSGGGLEIDGTNDATVEDCEITGVGSPAVLVDLGTKVVIRDCKTKGGVTGIQLKGDHCCIRDTSVDGAQSDGIFVLGTRNRVEGCQVTDAQLNGIAVGSFSGSAIQTVLFDNQIEDAVGDGILIDDNGTRSFVRGNTVLRAGIHGIEISNGGTLGGVIADNDVSKCGGSGIKLDADSLTIDGNRVKKCVANGIEVTPIAGDNMITGNRCTKNQLAGFRLEGADNTLIRNSDKGNAGGATNDTGLANHYADNTFSGPQE